eukprot:5064619-Pleurochrysis_carterae.AAC.1
MAHALSTFWDQNLGLRGGSADAIALLISSTLSATRSQCITRRKPLSSVVRDYNRARISH